MIDVVSLKMQGPHAVVMQGPMAIGNLEFLTTNFAAITATQIQKSAAIINDFAKAVTETSAKVNTNSNFLQDVLYISASLHSSR